MQIYNMYEQIEKAIQKGISNGYRKTYNSVYNLGERLVILTENLISEILLELSKIINFDSADYKVIDNIVKTELIRARDYALTYNSDLDDLIIEFIMEKIKEHFEDKK